MLRFVLAVLAVCSVLADAAALECSRGTKVAEVCMSSEVGCCMPDGVLRFCEGNLTCELDCTTFAKPYCGWNATAVAYDCNVNPYEEPNCAHPLSCYGHGCTPTWEYGCCGCANEWLVCYLDEYCCSSAWDASCTYYNSNYGGCGSIDGCVPNIGKGCFGCACEDCVCQQEPSCCSGVWDESCVTRCMNCGGNCQTCYPLCDGYACGDDSCGGYCGFCPNGTQCVNHQCACAPDCSSKQCGDDGCGGMCGTCPGGWFCVNHQCISQCYPDCANKNCGDDGCGGNCGTCDSGLNCSAAGVCVDCTPDCEGKQCGSDGCGGVCGWCLGGWTCNGDGVCINSCVPICAGRECGSDGCNGSCGSCGVDENCHNGQCETVCQPQCAGKECGSDGCGDLCGLCGTGKECDGTGHCVTACVPDCEGKNCGDNGCGGVCGICEGDDACSGDGQCIADCVPSCDGKECGDNGCGSSCGGCPDGLLCHNSLCVSDLPDAIEDLSPDVEGVDLAVNELPPIDLEAGDDSKTPTVCPAGTQLQFGMCVKVEQEPDEPPIPAASGCDAWGIGKGTGGVWWGLLFAMMWFLSLGLKSLSRSRGPQRWPKS